MKKYYLVTEVTLFVDPHGEADMGGVKKTVEHPNYVLIGKPCVVKGVVKDVIDGKVFFTSELRFNDNVEWEAFDDWFPYTEFNEWLLEEKGIELF